MNSSCSTNIFLKFLNLSINFREGQRFCVKGVQNKLMSFIKILQFAKIPNFTTLTDCRKLKDDKERFGSKIKK